MGNVIRLGIARIGLAVNSFWTATRKRAGRKPPTVLLVLGAQEAGKSTIASRILNYGKSETMDETYMPTKGFSVVELKDRGTTIRLHDLGGSDAVRELWTHYYPDAHGIIYVVDTSGRSSSIAKQSEILYQMLQDERVKRKPLLVLGNKQDVEAVQVEELVAQMNLIQMVNTAKCLTRVDLTSRMKVESFEDGLMIGFRWLIAYVKWHWAELSERVEHDSMLEGSRQNAKFEALRHKSTSSSPEPVKVEKEKKSAVGSPCSVTSLSFPQQKDEQWTNHSEDLVLMRPLKRLDPEGGNDVKEWKPDVSHQIILQHDTEDEFPEVVIVESRAEVHVYRSHSASAGTRKSSGFSVEAVFNAEPIISTDCKISNNETEEQLKCPAVPDGIITTKTVEQKRPKLFRNKTAPIRDEPIRIAITGNGSVHEGRATSTTNCFQIH